MGASAPGIGGIVGQRVALQEVTVVKQQAILRFAPRLGDLLRNRAEAKVRVRPVRAIIVGEQAGMQVAGGNQAERGGGKAL